MRGTIDTRTAGGVTRFLRRLRLGIVLYFSIYFKDSEVEYGSLKHPYIRYSPGLRGDSLLSKIAPSAHAFELRDPEVDISNASDFLTDYANDKVRLAREIVEQRFNEEGYVMVGQHLLCPTALAVMDSFFETAVDMRAYGPRLTAPFDHLIEDLPVVFADILSTDVSGAKILAGAEGSGIIDSSFTKHPIQVTIIIQNYEGGNWLAKGMLFPQEGVLDSNGNPCAKICHSEQVKGRMKNFSRSRSGVATGAIVDGVVVDESKLIETESVSALCGVLRTFNKPGRSRLAGQCLGMFKSNQMTRGTVLYSICEYIRKFHLDGGEEGVLNSKLDDNPTLKSLVSICRKLNVNPMDISFVRNYVNMAMGRKLYHLSQAAGMSCKTFVMRHDAGVPPGYVVVNMRGEDNRKLRDGDCIGAARFPILMPNGLLKLRYIDIDSGGVNLDHILVDGKVPQNMMVINPIDSAKMQADDDGDVAMLCTGPLLKLLDHKISLVPGNPSLEFLIEPEKFSDNPKGKIRVFEDGHVNPDALDILSKNTQGPVGMLSNYCLYFLSLRMYLHALVMAVAIQEAIDGGKHAIIVSDLDKLLDRNNWVEVSYQKIKPVNCAAEPDGPWIDASGSLDVDYLHKWVQDEVKAQFGCKMKMGDVLMWKTPNKRIDGDWPKTTDDKDLINYSAHWAKRLWKGYIEEHGARSSSSPVDMSLISKVADAFGYTVEELVVRDTAPYKMLMNASGLYEFGNFANRLLKKPDDGTHDTQLRGAEAILASSLSKMTVKDLLSIFATEIYGAINGVSGRTLTKAFRAISFPNSPVLEKLGIIEDAGCPFTSHEAVRVHLDEITGWMTTGLYDCWHEAINSWSDKMADEHFEQTGQELSDCSCCHARISQAALMMVRAKKRAKASSGNQEEAAKLTSSINKYLRG